MATEATAPPPTVLVTGANRGIGLELARQYAARGWTVIATARAPQAATALQELAAARPTVRIEPLDVTDAASVAALAHRCAGVTIDVLVNNAGILGNQDGQKPGVFDYDAFDAVMATNVKGPTRMAEAFRDHVAASTQKKLMCLSSQVGSLELTTGGLAFYCASKAALNMIMRTFHRELQRSPVPAHRGVIVGLIHPGVVDTGFARNLPIPMIGAAESATAVIRLIDGWTPEMSGDFYAYTGRKLPW